MMNESLWGMVGRQRHEEMLRQAAEFRRAAALPVPGALTQLLIGAGRSLERWGMRLAGGQVGDAAVGGIR